MRDLSDHLDLQRTAGKLLALVTSITPALDLIDPLMAGLISILQDSVVRRISIESSFPIDLEIVLANQNPQHACTEFSLLPQSLAIIGDVQGEMFGCEAACAWYECRADCPFRSWLPACEIRTRKSARWLLCKRSTLEISHY